MPTQLFQAVNGVWTAAGGHVVTVNGPGDRSSKVSSAVRLTIAATDDGATAPTLTWTATGLPSGLSIAADPANSLNGIITGTTASTTSTSAVTVTATDSQGYSGSASFAWAVVAAVTANTVTVNPINNRSTKVSTAVPGFSATASDSDPTITAFAWSDVAAGNHTLPPGLTIAAATGVVSGTTGGTAASYAVTIRATDSTGASGTTSFTWGVGTSAARGPADPGLGNMWFGANNGGMSIEAADVQIWGSAAGHKIHTAVREYNNSGNYLPSAADRTNITRWAAEGRCVFYSVKEGPTYTIAQAAAAAGGDNSAASANLTANIDSGAAFFAGLKPKPAIITVHHEPDNDFSDATSQNNCRVAARYVIGRYKRAGATNVGFCSPMYTGMLMKSVPTGWEKWHPNWDGRYAADGKTPLWDFDVLDYDAIDNYNPTLGNHLTSSSRSLSYDADITQRFLAERIRTKAKLLPWLIGEWGLYTYLATLDDGGVTMTKLFTDMVNVGVKSQNLIGITLWNTNLATMSDDPAEQNGVPISPPTTFDPGRTKRNAWKAALALLPVAGVTIP